MEKDINKLEWEEILTSVESNSIFDNGIFYFNVLSKYIAQIREPNIDAEFYKKALKALYEDDKDCFSSALQFIEYMEFRVFLYKIAYFFVRGLSHQAFSRNDTLEKCNIPEYTFRFYNLNYKKSGVKFLGNGNFSILKTPIDAANEKLNYNIDYKTFNLLEIALYLGDNELIKIALENDITNFRNIIYKEPYTLRTFDYSYSDDISQYFLCRDISLCERYEEYIKSLTPKKENETKEHIPNTPKGDGGIYNSFTGEIVRPRDDTFYIDDFR